MRCSEQMASDERSRLVHDSSSVVLSFFASAHFREKFEEVFRGVREGARMSLYRVTLPVYFGLGQERFAICGTSPQV